jgi:hypothetical protein
MADENYKCHRWRKIVEPARGAARTSTPLPQQFESRLKNVWVRLRKLQEPIVLSKLKQALSEIQGASQR